MENIEIFSEDLQKSITSRYKPKSQAQFISMIRWIYKSIDKDYSEKFKFKFIKNNIDTIIASLSKLCISTQSTYMNYLKILYDLGDRKFPLTLDEKLTAINEALKVKVLEQHHDDLDSAVNYRDVYDWMVSIVKSDKFGKKQRDVPLGKLQLFLCISILIDHPLRLNECLVDLFWSDDGSNNYIDIENRVMVIRHHKTERSSVGTKTFTLGDRLVEDLKFYQDKMAKIGQFKRVFIGNRTPIIDSPMSSQGATEFFTKLMKSYCKEMNVEWKPRSMGIHQVRKSYASTAVDNIGITSEQINALLNMLEKL